MESKIENLPVSSGAYCVMEDIEYYEEIGGLNEISKMVMQQHAIGQIIPPREKAIAALMELQAFGVTDEELLNIYEWLKSMHEKSLITGLQIYLQLSSNPISSSLLFRYS